MVVEKYYFALLYSIVYSVFVIMMVAHSVKKLVRTSFVAVCRVYIIHVVCTVQMQYRQTANPHVWKCAH